MAQLLSTLGLLLDMVGVLCLGMIVPKGVMLTVQDQGGPAVQPATPIAKWSDKWGWRFLFVGFALQLIAQWLPSE